MTIHYFLLHCKSRQQSLNLHQQDLQSCFLPIGLYLNKWSTIWEQNSLIKDPQSFVQPFHLQLERAYKFLIFVCSFQQVVLLENISFTQFFSRLLAVSRFIFFKTKVFIFCFEERWRRRESNPQCRLAKPKFSH